MTVKEFREKQEAAKDNRRPFIAVVEIDLTSDEHRKWAEAWLNSIGDKKYERTHGYCPSCFVRLEDDDVYVGELFQPKIDGNTLTALWMTASLVALDKSLEMYAGSPDGAVGVKIKEFE